MFLNSQRGKDWTQAKPCRECNVLPQVKCNLEWIQLICPICGRNSISHITHGIQVAIDDWNRYHTDDWCKL